MTELDQLETKKTSTRSKFDDDEAGFRIDDKGNQFRLEHHSEVELDNIQYIPGKTLEEIQSEGELNGKGNTSLLVDHSSWDHNDYGQKSHPSRAHHHHHSHHHGSNSNLDSTKKKRRFKNAINQFRHVLRALIVAHQVSHYLYIAFIMVPLFKDPFVGWTIKCICTVIFGLTTYSHVTTSSISTLSYERKKDPNYLSRQDYKACERCNDIWKPDRAHHCSVQKHDVIRMDHYCPITLSTIGFRNHGVFFNTAICHMVSRIQQASMPHLDDLVSHPYIGPL
jgi:hypothetical protein